MSEVQSALQLVHACKALWTSDIGLYTLFPSLPIHFPTLFITLESCAEHQSANDEKAFFSTDSQSLTFIGRLPEKLRAVRRTRT